MEYPCLWWPEGLTTHITLASLIERKPRKGLYLIEQLWKQKARKNYVEYRAAQTARTQLRRQEAEMAVFAGQII